MKNRMIVVLLFLFSASSLGWEVNFNDDFTGHAEMGLPDEKMNRWHIRVEEGPETEPYEYKGKVNELISACELKFNYPIPHEAYQPDIYSTNC